jgi:hypothetical protein
MSARFSDMKIISPDKLTFRPGKQNVSWQQKDKGVLYFFFSLFFSQFVPGEWFSFLGRTNTIFILLAPFPFLRLNKKEYVKEPQAKSSL